MARQFSTALRNARADQYESTIGASPVLKLYTGAQPADVAAAEAGSLLATIALPSDWLAAASGGAKAGSGLPWSAAATGTGTAGHYRLYASDGTTCHEQGACGVGTGDLQLDSTSVVAGGMVIVTAFTSTEGNA